MGNALVDIMIPLDDDLMLAALDLPKGSMQLVDKERSNQVLEKLKGRKWSQSAGGSAANTIHGIACLGAPTGYIGVIGEDELGGFFVRDLINAGVEPHLIHSTEETGRAVALISPDSERTFATYLGAAVELSAEHLGVPSSRFKVSSSRFPVSSSQFAVGGIFNRYDYFHIEGYLVQNHRLIETAVALAKQNNLIVSIDLASYNVVEANRDFLEEIIKKYVDIVFANEDEAKAFTGKEPADALKEISRMCKIAIVKTGSNGSMIKRGKEIFRIGIVPAEVIDTTGAGDLYASGFLYGLSNDFPLQRCGEKGALLASGVIEVIGSKMSQATWKELQAKVLE